MRRAGAVAAEVLEAAIRAVTPGMTTDALDAAVHAACMAAGAYPSPLNYAGFPKSVCTSLNEVVCHGIPETDGVIRRGDLVKVDVSVYVGGVHGDTCRTVIAGGADAAAADPAGVALIAATRRALAAAIAACGPGMPVSVVGAAIAPVLAAAGYTTVREFAGHGIGTAFHTHPVVLHVPNADATILRPGMTFTIEPMVVEGATPGVAMWPDGWTVVTLDGSRVAQFEHTLLVTEHGIDILTPHPPDDDLFAPKPAAVPS